MFGKPSLHEASRIRRLVVRRAPPRRHHSGIVGRSRPDFLKNAMDCGYIDFTTDVGQATLYVMIRQQPQADCCKGFHAGAADCCMTVNNQAFGADMNEAT